jgi:hypothetical protein
VLIDKQVPILHTSATLGNDQVLLYVGLNLIGKSFKCLKLLHSDRVLTLVL